MTSAQRPDFLTCGDVADVCAERALNLPESQPKS